MLLLKKKKKLKPGKSSIHLVRTAECKSEPKANIQCVGEDVQLYEP